MTTLTSSPQTIIDEEETFSLAESRGCPYLWLDGGRYRSLDQCMSPDNCECWRLVQLKRMDEDDQSYHGTSRDILLLKELSHG